MEPVRFLKLDEVKRCPGLGKSMIYRLIQEGKFPAPYKLSAAAARLSERELIAWIDDVKDGFEGKRRRVWQRFGTLGQLSRQAAPLRHVP